MKHFREPLNYDECYYVRYTINDVVHEFWTVNEENYKDKLGFIARHFFYSLKECREPLDT